MVLTANKGVALVAMDKDMYIEKCIALINDQEVYQECKDQTKSIHAKLLKQLLDLKKSKGPKFMDQYFKLCPPDDNSHSVRVHGLPKIHKANKPLRPIVSACGTSTYKLAKFLTKVSQ